MIIESAFKPAWWLKNPNMQTLWGALLRPHPAILLRRERLELPDGDFLDLDWTVPDKNSEHAPLVLILHGLGGSIDSHYARHALLAIQRSGWRGVFMHYRGCSGVPNRKPRCYHSGFTEDVHYVVSLLKSRYAHADLAIVGYSLGANILLKWLSENRDKSLLKTAVAISAPFDLENGANRMLQGFSRIYQWYILKALRQTLQHKFSLMEAPINIKGLRHYKTFWEFDHHITAPLHGFAGVIPYYRQSSCRQYLKNINTPTLILHAKDDPFMTADAIPQAHELSNQVTLELSEHGGHVGFISGTFPGAPQYWLEQRVAQHLAEHLGTPAAPKKFRTPLRPPDTEIMA